MTEVVSIRFKSCGKNYFFAPEGIHVEPGEKVIVDTAKGLEMAECTRENHLVEDEAVVQPLRSVVRKATAQDLRTAEENKIKEAEALIICKQKIAEHGLDMKLVGVERNFEGTKTLFFFTSDGRVDFRELVKDLASIFHNRIELRQIGVRDEAKMIGGIGICGRPYCCSQFLNDFAPVSTKMAKTQSLSLNPVKISGSCGRLMCCLRYEEEAYSDLLKQVPKQGAFVQTIDGYGTAVQVNVLRQRVKVHLDGESEDALHEYTAEQVAAVPGGRPNEGEKLPSILNYNPPEEEETVSEEPDLWNSPSFFAEVEEAAKENDAENTDRTGEETPGKQEGEAKEAFEKRSDKPRRRNSRYKKQGYRRDGKQSGEGVTKDSGKTDKPERKEKPAKSGKTEKSGKSEQMEKSGRAGNPEKESRPEKNEKVRSAGKNPRKKQHSGGEKPHSREDRKEASPAVQVSKDNKQPTADGQKKKHYYGKRKPYYKKNGGNAQKTE